MFDLAWVKQF